MQPWVSLWYVESMPWTSRYLHDYISQLCILGLNGKGDWVSCLCLFIILSVCGNFEAVLLRATFEFWVWPPAVHSELRVQEGVLLTSLHTTSTKSSCSKQRYSNKRDTHLGKIRLESHKANKYLTFWSP